MRGPQRNPKEVQEEVKQPSKFNAVVKNVSIYSKLTKTPVDIRKCRSFLPLLMSARNFQNGRIVAPVWQEQPFLLLPKPFRPTTVGNLAWKGKGANLSLAPFAVLARGVVCTWGQKKCKNCWWYHLPKPKGLRSQKDQLSSEVLEGTVPLTQFPPPKLFWLP